MNGYFYMPVSTWMCHASWVRTSLTNSSWSSLWARPSPFVRFLPDLSPSRCRRVRRDATSARQAPPPALSGEMSGKSERAWGRANKPLRVDSSSAWLLQMLLLGHPEHVYVHSCIHQPVLHNHFVWLCVHEKPIPLLQMEHESAVTWEEKDIRLLL